MNNKERLNGSYFDDLANALNEAVQIERGIIPVEIVENMKYTTYRVSKKYNEKDGQDGE